MPHSQTMARNVVRAIIRVNDHILFVRRRAGIDSAWIALPGGGQRAGESLVEALVRECQEELGITPSVNGLAFVRDFIPSRLQGVVGGYQGEHDVEFYFECRLADCGIASLKCEASLESILIDAGQSFPASIRPMALVDYLRTGNVGGYIGVAD